MDAIPEGLSDWLSEARELGLLGPVPIEDHVTQADRFRRALGTTFTGSAVDLGTGAGIPGLILAAWWPDSRWTLIDAKQRRAALVSRVVRSLGWEARVEVRCGRAEAFAHEPAFRERYPLVVARAFGPPAVVAECATGFVEIGGRLAVSEPPDADEVARWDGAPLGQLGLEAGTLASSVQVINKVAATPKKFPRRIGMPTKRPLF